MVSPEPSEKGSNCCKLCHSRAVPWDTALPHKIEACCFCLSTALACKAITVLIIIYGVN